MISDFKDEWIIRALVFLVVAVILFLGEKIFPRFKLENAKRQLSNFSLHIVNIVTIRLVFPGAAISFALLSEKLSFGVLRAYVSHDLLLVLLTILILEWAVYVQHVLFHKVPFLWRLHRVHHCDTSIDFTTALRFHPLEILISLFFKGFIIFFMGLSVNGVIIFEILLNSIAMFNHANLRLPNMLENFLRMFIVTPEMHRIHHSKELEEHNKNFSFGLSIWDRIFKTYKKPDLSREKFFFGTGNSRLDGEANLFKLLFSLKK
ncbi:MAG: sterol desaturase family protein [Halobacteriovoraceae bacterium]|nr:sterol desaturase family protein [Halobacteriovoraceae bacterium]